MDKLTSRLLQELEKKEGDPEALESLIRAIEKEPTKTVADLGIEIPQGVRIGFFEDPSELAAAVFAAVSAEGSVEPGTLRKRLRKFAANLEWIPVFQEKDDSMPAGAMELNEAQLKRIVG